METVSSVQGLLADSPNRRWCPCWQSCVNSEISSLVLPLLLAPKTTNFERSYSWACRAPFGGRRHGHAQSQDFGNQVLRRKNAAGTLAREEQLPALADRGGGFRGRPEVETARSSRGVSSISRTRAKLLYLGS